MPEITELPISGKTKDKFISFLKTNPLDQIRLGDFGKWEGGGTCAVCGHRLIWSFRDDFKHRDIGICCGANILALQECKGNFDELNFKRQLALQKKTIIARQKRWEKQQKAQQLEIQYNDEFKFCTKVLELVFSDNAFREYIGHRDGEKFFYAGMGEERYKPIHKVLQCNSWLGWLRDGTVNEFYLSKLHDTMKHSPEQIVEEAAQNLKTHEEKRVKEAEEHKLNYDGFNKVLKLKKARLSVYDVDFVKSLSRFFDEKNYYTEKQKQSIDKLHHRYRKQIDDIQQRED